jgi:hypothetical protein
MGLAFTKIASPRFLRRVEILMLRPRAGCKRHTTAIRLPVGKATTDIEPADNLVQFPRTNGAH